MATRVIEVPDAQFAGFYYPEILRDALAFFRRDAEKLGLTDENDFEVHIQMLRSFAFVGHLTNTRLDTVATELLIDTLTLLESLKRLLRLIGIEVASATPATVDLLLTLSEVITSNVSDFVPVLAEFATDSVPPISYEVLAGLDLDRTDQVSHVYGFKRNRLLSDGSFSTSAPDVIESATAAYTAADLSRHVVVAPGNAGGATIFNNVGEFRIIEIISGTQARVVRIPDSEPPGFQTEAAVSFAIYEFSADGATAVNTAGAPFFDLWTGGGVSNDALYIAHSQAQWNQIDIAFNTPLGGANTARLVWEYFDNERSKFSPKTVTDNLDGTLTFEVSTLLGVATAPSAVVTVEYVPTGAKEIAASDGIGGTNNVTTLGLLGQSGSPSTDVTDYLVTAAWVPCANQVDGTVVGTSLEQDGDIQFDLPQTRDRSWLSTDVNLNEAMWIRGRAVTSGGSPNPSIDTIQIDQGAQYLAVIGTQGETVGPKIVGSSDGTSRQQFELPDNPFIDATELIEVDEAGGGNFVTYTRVLNFLSSTVTSRHYVRESDAEGVATITFGDGVTGKIPPAGVDNIRATYRIGADESGNVGPDTVTVNADGTAQISTVTNPRQGAGWKQKDGGSEADIERLKRDGPASLRTRNTGTNTGDIQRLAVNEFTDRNGAQPIARAVAVPEGLGPKTVKLLVVGTGGTTLTGAQIEDVEEYFNGDRYARPQVEGSLVLNHELSAFNFEPRLISVVATVVWPNGNAEAIRNALLALLTPLSLEEDGTTYTWDFGGTAAISRVYSEIHAIDPTIVRVPTLTLNGVAGSLALGANQLPTSTAAGIQINIQG